MDKQVDQLRLEKKVKISQRLLYHVLYMLSHVIEVTTSEFQK